MRLLRRAAGVTRVRVRVTVRETMVRKIQSVVDRRSLSLIILLEPVRVGTEAEGRGGILGIR